MKVSDPEIDRVTSAVFAAAKQQGKFDENTGEIVADRNWVVAALRAAISATENHDQPVPLTQEQMVRLIVAAT